MKSNVSLLLLALPLWLASCAPSMDLIGERSTETDEFYLTGGEAHVGDMAIEAARQQMLLDQYDEYMAADYDDPYGGQYINAPRTPAASCGTATRRAGAADSIPAGAMDSDSAPLATAHTTAHTDSAVLPDSATSTDSDSAPLATAPSTSLMA